MAEKEIYCMGRAEALNLYYGYTLIDGYRLAEEEWEARTTPHYERRADNE